MKVIKVRYFFKFFSLSTGRDLSSTSLKIFPPPLTFFPKSGHGILSYYLTQCGQISLETFREKHQIVRMNLKVLLMFALSLKHCYYMPNREKTLKRTRKYCFRNNNFFRISRETFLLPDKQI